jgi:hypothetical protein
VDIEIIYMLKTGVKLLSSRMCRLSWCPNTVEARSIYLAICYCVSGNIVVGDDL